MWQFILQFLGLLKVKKEDPPFETLRISGANLIQRQKQKRKEKSKWWLGFAHKHKKSTLYNSTEILELKTIIEQLEELIRNKIDTDETFTVDDYDNIKAQIVEFNKAITQEFIEISNRKSLPADWIRFMFNNK